MSNTRQYLDLRLFPYMARWEDGSATELNVSNQSLVSFGINDLWIGRFLGDWGGWFESGRSDHL